MCRVQLRLIGVPKYRVLAIASTLQRVRVIREHDLSCPGIRQTQHCPLETTTRYCNKHTVHDEEKNSIYSMMVWWDGGESDRVVKHGNSPHAQMLVLSASCSGSLHLVQIFRPHHKNCYLIQNDSGPGSRCGDSIFPLTPPHFIWSTLPPARLPTVNNRTRPGHAVDAILPRGKPYTSRHRSPR